MTLRGNLAKTGLALMAAGGMWGLIYYYEYRGEESLDTAKEKEKDVFSFEREKVVGLEIGKNPGGLVSLRKESGAWKIESPLSTSADGDKVESILTSLGFLRSDQDLGDVPDAEMGNFKLKDPEARLTIKLADGKEDLGLLIGDKVPVGGGYYASRPGSGKVIVVSGGLESVVTADLASLRYRKVIGVDSWKLERFRIEKDGRSISLARHEDDWRLESPVPFPADRSKVQSLWSDLQTAEAESFETENPTEDDLKRFGLDHPALTLAVEAKEGAAPVRVAFAAPKDAGTAYARRSDMAAVMKIKQDVLDKLEKVAADASDLRDPRAAPVDRYKVAHLELKQPVGPGVILAKDQESKWHWGGPEGAEMASQEVNSLLDAVDEVKATAFMDTPGVSGEGPAALTLTLKEGEGADARSTTLTILAEGGLPTGRSGRRVTSTASSSIYIVPSTAAQTLIDRASSMKEPAAPVLQAVPGEHSSQGDGSGTQKESPAKGDQEKQ